MCFLLKIKNKEIRKILLWRWSVNYTFPVNEWGVSEPSKNFVPEMTKTMKKTLVVIRDPLLLLSRHPFDFCARIKSANSHPFAPQSLKKKSLRTPLTLFPWTLRFIVGMFHDDQFFFYWEYHDDNYRIRVRRVSSSAKRFWLRERNSVCFREIDGFLFTYTPLLL